MIAYVKQKRRHLPVPDDALVEAISMTIKRIIYIVGFIWLCYLDHIIGTAGGNIQYALKNYTGVVIGIIILTAYKIRDFAKLPYLIWGIVFLVGRWITLNHMSESTGNLGQLEATLWNIGLYGIIIIRMCYAWLVERKKPHIQKPVLGLWCVIMVLMIICRTDVTWPRWFFLQFGCLYLTRFRKKDLNNLYIGIIEGIIIGFLLLQGYAFLHRPYDMLRYEGMYSNSNINALFYLTVYGAVLAKWYQMKLMRRPKWVRLPMILLTGVLFSLTFFTMGRTALIVMVLLTIIFLVFQAISQKRQKVKFLLLDGLVILASIIICFVPTYFATRYIPAFVDDPRFFMGDEGKMDLKVQKGDPIDSEKYVDLEQVLENAFGRILWFLEEEEEESYDVMGELLSWVSPGLIVYAQEEEWSEEDWDWSEFDEVYIEPGTDSWHPILTKEEYEKYPVKVRTSIYRYYLEHIKAFGKRDGSDLVWVSPTYNAPHAHNIFLQIAGDFGGVVAILFVIFVFLSYNTVSFSMAEKKQGDRYYRYFVVCIFTTITIGFGMLEMCWIYGQLPFTLLFFVQYMIFQKEKGKK